MQLINMLIIILPLIIMAAILIYVFYYTNTLRTSCKTRLGGTKAYWIVFLSIFGLVFTFHILLAFLTWADFNATIRYLWDRIILPALFTALASATASLPIVKLLIK